MLRNNGSNFGRVTFLGGALYANGFPRVAARQRLIENFSGFGQRTSMPQGYQSATKALIPTLKESWDMFVMFRGDGSFAVAALTAEDMTVGFSGEGTFSPNAQHAYTMTVEFLGEGTLSLTAEQLEQASVAFDSGTRPSAFDISQEVWQAQAASYSAAGSMGEKLNNAGLSPEQLQMLVDLWTLAGLDINNPLSVSTTQRIAGAISQLIEETDGVVTVTRD